NMDSYNNPYKFNGKEMDRETGMYYYGARYYDPRISIFVRVDPLAEQTMEPYLYVGNNPIMFTDPTRMSKEPWIRKKGTNEVVWRANVTSSKNTPKGYSYIGERYRGIKIHGYRAYRKNNLGGLQIRLSYDDGKGGTADARFIQTVRTNDPLGGAKSPYNDPQPPDDDKPFYYTDAELPGRQNINGEDITFYDAPKRYTTKDVSWEGELSVVADEGVGYQTKGTITYGFEIQNGKVKTNEIKFNENQILPYDTGESSFQKSTINEYNKSRIGPRRADGTF